MDKYIIFKNLNNNNIDYCSIDNFFEEVYSLTKEEVAGYIDEICSPVEIPIYGKIAMSTLLQAYDSNSLSLFEEDIYTFQREDLEYELEHCNQSYIGHFNIYNMAAEEVDYINSIEDNKKKNLFLENIIDRIEKGDQNE